MIKVIGMICLVSGFCGLAFDKIRMEKEQIKNLMEIRDFVCYLKGEIDYSHIPIPDICHEYSDRTEGKIRIFLKNLCKNFETNEGQSFQNAWECEVGKMEIKKEEQLLLKKLGKCFGFSNVEMQKTAVANYLQDLEKVLLHYEKKFQGNRKLILYFGVMSGLLLSIVLL